MFKIFKNNLCNLPPMVSLALRGGWLVLFIGLVTSFNYGGCGVGDTVVGSSIGNNTPSTQSTPSVITNPATEITQTTATLNGTVNPNGVGIVVYFQFGTTINDGTTNYQNIGSSTTPVNVSVNMTGLSPNTIYNFRIMAIRGSGTGIVFNGAIRTFTTTGLPPICVTNPATNITFNSARLNGTVNPNGATTTVYFNYGLTTSYGNTTTLQAIDNGTTSVAVSSTVSSLTLNAEYNFRVVGTNSSGTTSGDNLMFTTGNSFGSVSTCTTDPADNITYNSAILNGTVIPNGVTTNAYFQWGTTTFYGNTTTAQSIGNGITSVVITAALSGLPANTFYNFRVVGASSAGTIYGNNLTFSTTPPPPLSTTNVATNITFKSATLNGTVNPNGVTTTAYFNYGLTTSYGSSTILQLIGSGTTNVPIYADIIGLLGSAIYNFRVAGTNSSGTTYGNNLTFTTATPPPPTCTTNVATNITFKSVTLNGTVNPNGVFATTAYFEWGTTVSYGKNTASQVIDGGGTSNVVVYADISRLLAITQYNFRVVAINAGGTTNGLNQTFTTTALPPPTCTTNAAIYVADTSATLNGTVNPNDLDVTSCYFDYDTSQSYGSQQNITQLLPLTGSNPISVTANVSSLTPSTLYNFRVVATNAGGTTNGNNQTFTTAISPIPPTDDYCWVANAGSDNVTRVTKSTSATTDITVGIAPYGIAVDDAYVWVANAGYYSLNSSNPSNTVTRITKSTLATTNITVGSSPSGVAVDDTYCWVTNFGSLYTSLGNTVTRITKSTLATTDITVGSGPYGIAVDGTYVWVTLYGNPFTPSYTVTRITKSTLATTNITVNNNPWGIAVDETYCWVVTAGTNTVTRITKSTLATTTIPLSPEINYIRGVAVDGTYCWVTSIFGNIIRITKSTLATTNITAGIGSYGVAVDGTYVWVTNNISNNVTRILKSDLSTTAIAVGTNPISLGDMTGYAYNNYARRP